MITSEPILSVSVNSYFSFIRDFENVIWNSWRTRKLCFIRFSVSVKVASGHFLIFPKYFSYNSCLFLSPSSLEIVQQQFLPIGLKYFLHQESIEVVCGFISHQCNNLEGFVFFLLMALFSLRFKSGSLLSFQLKVVISRTGSTSFI